jgi:hypothetical protein
MQNTMNKGFGHGEALQLMIDLREKGSAIDLMDAISESISRGMEESDFQSERHDEQRIYTHQRSVIDVREEQ